MRKLQALTAYIMEVTDLPRENVQSFADKGELTPTGRDLGHGIELGVFKYDAVIQIENYPGDGHAMLALLLGWLCDHDPDRELNELAEPEVDADLNDDRTVDLEIAVEFEEPLCLVPDDDGEIRFNGRRWRVVGDVPVDVAEELASLDGTANG